MTNERAYEIGRAAGFFLIWGAVGYAWAQITGQLIFTALDLWRYFD